jgi:hypothetical protein
MGHGRSAGGRADDDVVPRRGKAGAPGEGEAATPVASAGADAGAGETASEEGRRRRSPRSTALPPPPADRTIDYALSRDELRDIEPGEVVLAIERLDGFEAVVRPVLDEVDARRSAPCEGESKRRGRRPSYNAIDYWRLEVLRRVIAAHSTKHTRDWLTTDRAARTRELLCFDAPRAHYGGKPRRLMEGIPSDGWVSDFRTKWLPEAELARLMCDLEKWALAEKLKTLPGMRDECRTLHADGSKLETHATAPKLKRDKKTKEAQVVNEWKKGRDGQMVSAITAPEAGYVGNGGGNADHAGHGWNIVMVMSSRGTVLAHRNVPLNAAENETLAGMAVEVSEALGVFRQREVQVRDRREEEVWVERDLRVLSTDAAFHGQATRRAWRAVGVVENTHLSSHAARRSSERTAKRRTERRYPIAGHPDWFANGHRELVCRCGKGKVSRVVRLDRKGRAIVSVKGECAKDACGSVLITSGWWRLSSNTQFVKCTSRSRATDAELEFGNPLTFNDPLAREYGQQRFNGQEGAFGSQFTQRFRLLKTKRWFYRQTQVDLEVAAVVTITHALSLERWRRRGSPPAEVEGGDGGGDGAGPACMGSAGGGLLSEREREAALAA